MNVKQDYLFWNLIHLLIAKLEYRIVKISEQQNEVWLESLEKKNAQVIRLLRVDLDWGNWLKRDMENSLYGMELIRKRMRKKELHVVNVYVSTFAPVDDWQYIVKKPLVFEDRTHLEGVVIESSDIQTGLATLASIINTPLPYDENLSVDEEDVERVKHKALSTAMKRTKNEQQLFSQGKPRFTYFFIAAQILMFIILEMSGGSTNTLTLMKMGAKYNPLIIEGEWWRFFTPIFLHIGFLHLAMNTLALYYLGIAVEKIFGNIRFLLIYLFSGFMGSLASFVFSPSLSAGASGAIFGCFGALLYFGMAFPGLFKRTMGSSIITVIGINLAFGFIVPGIDNAGHIGGLVGGFLAAGLVHIPKQKLGLKQLIFLFLTIVITSGLLFYGYHYPKNDDPKLLVGLAQEYIQDKQYDKAISLLEDVHTIGDTGAQVYFLLSYAEIHKGDLKNAQLHLEQAIGENPTFHEAYFNLALVYMDQGHYRKAKASIDKAIELEPNNKDYEEVLKQLNQQVQDAE